MRMRFSDKKYALHRKCIFQLPVFLGKTFQKEKIFFDYLCVVCMRFSAEKYAYGKKEVEKREKIQKNLLSKKEWLSKKVSCSIEALRYVSLSTRRAEKISDLYKGVYCVDLGESFQ